MRQWFLRAPGLIVLLHGVFVVLIPCALFPICESAHLGWTPEYQPTMRCFWYGQAEILLGLCVCVAGLGLLLRPTRDCGFAMGLMLLVLGVGIVLVSCNGVIGSTCGHAVSRCQIGTKPASRLAGGLTCVFGAVLLARSFRRSGAS
ncbi:MAG: DUF4418 family protein [Planctomycetes bacterium]|nr:DUF4418 family protein [Planctomycetota bacterium]